LNKTVYLAVHQRRKVKEFMETRLETMMGTANKMVEEAKYDVFLEVTSVARKFVDDLGVDTHEHEAERIVDVCLKAVAQAEEVGDFDAVRKVCEQAMAWSSQKNKFMERRLKTMMDTVDLWLKAAANAEEAGDFDAVQKVYERAMASWSQMQDAFSTDDVRAWRHFSTRWEDASITVVGHQEVRLRVAGAGGFGSRCNGVYEAAGQHAGRTSYQQVGGQSIIYYTPSGFYSGWKIHCQNDTRGWYYLHPDTRSAVPPAGLWTINGSTMTANPPPSVTHIQAEANKNDGEVTDFVGTRLKAMMDTANKMMEENNFDAFHKVVFVAQVFLARFLAAFGSDTRVHEAKSIAEVCLKAAEKAGEADDFDSLQSVCDHAMAWLGQERSGGQKDVAVFCKSYAAKFSELRAVAERRMKLKAAAGRVLNDAGEQGIEVVSGGVAMVEGERVGLIVRRDEADPELTYKVMFLDGLQPKANWFSRSAVEVRFTGADEGAAI